MSQYTFDQDRYMQIDVKKVSENIVLCNMYTGVLCVEITIKRNDYDELIRKGFFVRDGKKLDSANLLNTSEVYRLPVATVID